jgi:hypothetical protein
MEALQIKDKIDFSTFLKTRKTSAKRVTVAQQEGHLAQFQRPTLNSLDNF